jgi:hypothetical protein
VSDTTSICDVKRAGTECRRSSKTSHHQRYATAVVIDALIVAVTVSRATIQL